MPNREDILREQTFKEEDLPIHKRVFYSLTKDESVQHDRTAKFVALLTEMLVDSDAMSEDDLDEILLKIVIG
jgi:hypothetical protein